MCEDKNYADWFRQLKDGNSQIHWPGFSAQHNSVFVQHF